VSPVRPSKRRNLAEVLAQPNAPWPETDPRFTRDYLRDHRDEFRDQCLKIRTKHSQIVPLRANYSQRQIERVITEERAAGHRPQLIILKSRQVGISTWAQALAFEDTFLNDHRDAFIIADKAEHTKLMIQINRRFLRNLPKLLRPESKDMKLENVHGLQFPWDSRIQVETEGDAHSMTANILHLTEFAYFKRPDDTLKEAMPAVPKDPSSLVLMESTANGQGNEFYDLFSEAVERKMRGVHRREQGWRPIFIPWWKHEEYRTPSWFSPLDTTLAEERLMERFKLHIDQIAWRRECVRDIFKGDEEEFETRFPTTWEDAFKKSGRPVFLPDQMDRLLDLAPPRKNEGSLWVVSNPCELDWNVAEKKPVIRFEIGGRLRLFRDYNERRTYRIGADPSEGDRKSDPTPLELIDFTGDWTGAKKGSIDQAGEWWGREPADVLAKHAAWLGMLYGHAEIVGEANNHGILFFATLDAMNYPAVYYRTTHEEDVSGGTTTKPGIMSTNKQKHAAIGVYRQWLREEKGLISSPQLLTEMGTTVYYRRSQTDLGNADLVTKITKPSNKTIDCVWAFAWPLLVHRGSDANPLLPLPEKVLMSAAAQILIARERDPVRADQMAMDLTGLTGDEVLSILDARLKRRRGHRGGAEARTWQR
jgi:hypothetical protein